MAFFFVSGQNLTPKKKEEEKEKLGTWRRRFPIFLL
jgi:hypothetical protein